MAPATPLLLAAALGYITQPTLVHRTPARAGVAMRLRPRRQIKVGQMLPDAAVVLVSDGCAANDSCAKVSARDLVGGEGVNVLIGMPGAFTPTCNDVHLPQYIRSAWAFRAMGVRSLSVLTTNDQFILTAWKGAMAECIEAQGLDTLDSSLRMLADPGEWKQLHRTPTHTRDTRHLLRARGTTSASR